MSDTILKSQTSLLGADPYIIKGMFRHEAETHNIRLTEEADGSLVLITEIGELRLMLSPAPTIEVVTTHPEWLYMLKDSVAEHVAHLVNQEAAANLRWSDGEGCGAQPPDLRICQVYKTQKISQDFVRVWVRGERFEYFGEHSLHFRLLLPPNGTTPVWPTVGKNGRVLWPEGKDTIHTAVYTTQSVDDSHQVLSFDVYLHEGGPTANWALTATSGGVLGIIGPRGSGIPDCECIVLYGDETALPAIDHIIRTTNAAISDVIISAQHHDYPLDQSKGYKLHWIDSCREPNRLAELACQQQDDGKTYLWFAAGQAAAKKVRTHLKDQSDWPGARLYCAGFWQEYKGEAN